MWLNLVCRFLADEGSRVIIFEEIFADIGDDVYWATYLPSLATQPILDILGKVSQHSLLLLDELRLVLIPRGRPCHGQYRTFACVDGTMSHHQNSGLQWDSLCAKCRYGVDTIAQPIGRFLMMPSNWKRLGLSSYHGDASQRSRSWDNDVNRIIEQWKNRR